MKTRKPTDKPFRYFVLYKSRRYVNIMGYGWEQQFNIGMSERSLATWKAHPCCRVEDMLTGDILFSSLDLPQNVYVATTQWPDRDRFTALLKNEN